MPRGPAVRQADIDRALKSLARAGLAAASITIRAGGEVVITPGPLTPSTAPGDLAAPVDELDAFRARKNARRAAQRA